jgi:nucleotide-binding universal stress UspA family protein
MYQRILVPVDGSETSDKGLKEAVRLAREQGARLRLVHVIDQSAMPAGPYGGFYTEAVADALRQSGQAVIDAAEKFVRAEGVQVEQKVLENIAARVADVIVEEAGNWGADLIVMGTHGRRGVSHLFLGSDAEAVVRMSPVPVLLVRALATPTKVKEAIAA